MFPLSKDTLDRVLRRINGVLNSNLTLGMNLITDTVKTEIVNSEVTEVTEITEIGKQVEVKEVKEVEDNNLQSDESKNKTNDLRRYDCNSIRILEESDKVITNSLLIELKKTANADDRILSLVNCSIYNVSEEDLRNVQLINSYIHQTNK